MEKGANVTFRIPVWLDKVFAWPVVRYRRRKYGYEFRRIYLGEGKFTIVDEQDYYRYNDYRWSPQKKSRTYYAIRVVSNCEKTLRIVSLHREIMNEPKGLLVDHKNGDGLDNRRANLRTATKFDSVHNRRKRKTKTSSRYTGVNIDKETGRWVARIRNRGKRTWLGSFKDEAAAARAYDEAAKKYHGEFARLNFPEETTKS